MEQDAEIKVQAVNSNLQKVQEEAAKKAAELKLANEQINLLTREKGVAMRDNAASYEQSIQKETQVIMQPHILTWYTPSLIISLTLSQCI